MQRIYFQSLRHALSACRDLPDDEVAASVAPLTNLVDALQLKALAYGAHGEFAIDSRPDSGLPIYDRVASVVIDHQARRDARSQEDLSRLMAEREVAETRALDEIILDKRRPSPVVARDLSRVGYEIYLDQCRSMHTALVGAVQRYVAPGGEARPCVTWTFWDTTRSCAVRCFATFEKGTDGVPDFQQRMRAIARNFDTLSFPLVAVAAAVDAEFPELGILGFSRIVFGPFHAPLFLRETDHPMVRALDRTGAPPEHRWAFTVRREDIRHSGSFVHTGFFRRRKLRVFDVDSHDPECDAIGATAITTTILTPWQCAQRLISDPELQSFLVRKRLESVSADGTIIR